MWRYAQRPKAEPRRGKRQVHKRALPIRKITSGCCWRLCGANCLRWFAPWGRFESLGIMASTELSSQPTSLPLAGRRVYAAGVIAAYTILANIPVGCVLYGLNLRSRGDRLRGCLMIAIGIIAGMALVSVSLFAHMTAFQSRMLLILAIFSGVCFYRFEREPVRAALRDGASLARWWPPALFLALICIVIFLSHETA